jgi:hypothetical protein
VTRHTFNPDIIAELRCRIARHNAACPGAPVKLQELKKRYGQWAQGPEPHEAAMSRIDKHLERLAKAFEEDKHPRGRAGKFESKGGGEQAPSMQVGLPADAAEHARMQRSNAGYDALTSDIIPDHRREEAGLFAREVGSLGAGTALTLAAYHDGGKGAFSRAVPKATGAAAAGIARGLTMGRARWAVNAARWAGRGAGWAAAQVAPRIVHAAVKMAQSAHPMPEPGAPAGEFARYAFRRGASKAGVLAGASVLTGLAIDHALKNSWLDPQDWGAGFDKYSYRTVRKFADVPGLDEAMLQIRGNLRARLLESARTGIPLEKSVSGRFIGAASTGAATVLAGLAGAAAGAGVGAAAHAGARQYYRDRMGRFASRGNAVTAGAALGAVAAGLAGFYALRRGNVARFMQVARAALTHHADMTRILTKPDAIRAHVARIRETLAKDPKAAGIATAFESDPLAKLADRYRKRDDLIREAVENDDVHKAALADLDRYGEANPTHYKEQVANHINSNLAHGLANIPAFKIRATWKPKSPWMTMAEVLADKGFDERNLVGRVMIQISKMSAADFDEATSGLTKVQRDNWKKVFDSRQTAIDGVEQQIAAHRTAIDKAATAVKKAETALNDARSVEAAATDPEAKKAAASALAQKQQAYDDADMKHRKLLASPPVKSPTGAPLTPFSPSQERVQLNAAAKKRAEAKVDAATEALRQKLLKRSVDRHDHTIATIANLGGRAAPSHLRDPVATLQRAHASHRNALAEVSQAEAEHATANSQLSDARAAARGQRVEGKTETDLEAMANSVPQHEERVARAKERLKGARDAAVTARQQMHEAALNFGEHLGTGSRPSGRPTKRRIPFAVAHRMSSDFAVLGGKTGKAVDQLIARPTRKALVAFAAEVGRSASAVGKRAKRLGSATLEQFKRGEGAERHYDIGRIGRVVAVTGGGAVLADAGHDLYERAKRRYFPDTDLSEKFGAASKLGGRFRYETGQVDPLTGAGWHGISVQDPENPKDRVLVFGEHYRNDRDRSAPIQVGVRTSEMRDLFTRAQENQRRQLSGGLGQGAAPVGPRDVTGLKPEDKTEIDRTIGEIKAKMERVDTEGGAASFRHEEETVGQGPSDKFVNHIKNTYLENGSPAGKKYFDALEATVHSNQGRILKKRQAFSLLTGYTPQGARVKSLPHAIFKDNPDFESSDHAATARALAAEADRAIDTHRMQTEQQRASLLRAIGTVASVKGTPNYALQSVIDRIKSAPIAAAAASPPPWPGAAAGFSAFGARPGTRHEFRPSPDAPASEPSAPPPEQPKARSAPAANPDIDLRQVPRTWTTQEENLEVNRLIDAAKTHLGAKTDLEAQKYAQGFRSALVYAKNLYPDMSMQDAGDVVRHAILEGFAANAGDSIAIKGMREILSSPRGFGVWHNLIVRAHDDLNKRFDPAAYFGSLIRKHGDAALAKGYDSWLDEARNAFGEWTSSGAAGAADAASGAHGAGQSPAQRATQEVLDGATEAVARQASKQPSKAGTPWYSPSRFIPEFGSNLAGDAASVLASAALGGEGQIGRFALTTLAPGLLGQAGGKAAATGVRWAVKGAVPNAAYFGANAAAKMPLNAATDAAYRAAGVRRPNPAPPESDLGRMAASGLGSMIGSIKAVPAVKAALGPELTARILGRRIGAGIGDALGTVTEAAGPEIGLPATIALQSVGGYAGGLLASGLYDAGSAISRWFQGYDKDTAHRVLTRYGPPPRVTGLGHKLGRPQPQERGFEA